MVAKGDAVAIPFALNLPGTATTTCPACAERHRLVLPDGADNDRRLVWFPLGGERCDPTRGFCSAANLFCDIDHLVTLHGDTVRWTGRPLTIGEAAQVGRVRSDVAAEGA